MNREAPGDRATQARLSELRESAQERAIRESNEKIRQQDGERIDQSREADAADDAISAKALKMLDRGELTQEQYASLGLKDVRTERAKDFAGKDRARAVVEAREADTNDDQNYAEHARALLREGKISQAGYDSLRINPEITKKFRGTEAKIFAYTAHKMLQEGSIEQSAYDLLNIDESILAQDQFERAEEARLLAQLQAAKEDGNRVMGMEDAEESPMVFDVVARDRERLEATKQNEVELTELMNAADKRREAKSEQDKKKSA